MLLVDTRRLTGPNLLAREPLVLVELAFEVHESRELLDDALEAYRRQLARMREALGLPSAVELLVRTHEHGADVAYASPIDVMLACAEMSEWAALSAIEILSAREPLALSPKRAEIEALLARDGNPHLLLLAAEARRRALPLLWDDAEVSIGAGARSIRFAASAIPDAAEVAWDALGTIPVALITGTNGKTTSSRLLARVAQQSGLVVACTSTEGVTIGNETVATGDWTGPAAARLALRRRDVELAVLETARGGILRRGLAIDDCDVALITNVSDDHLGSYGIDDVATMAAVKGVVAGAVREGGTLILNARDPNLVALAAKQTGKVTFFADLDDEDDAGDHAARAVIDQHRSRGGAVVVTRDGAIVCMCGDEQTTLLSVDAVPITFGGAARYNVDNALGVVAAARALRLPDEAIVAALSTFDTADNPRRGELLERRGVRILLDFGHNPAGIRGVMRLVSSLRAASAASQAQTTSRLTVVTGSAGDRSNREIESVAREIWRARPDRVFVRELQGYDRGRAVGEVPEVFRRAFHACGLSGDAFSIATSEVDALRRAFEDATRGDFIALLVHLEDRDVRAYLDGLVTAATAPE